MATNLIDILDVGRRNRDMKPTNVSSCAVQIPFHLTWWSSAVARPFLHLSWNVRRRFRIFVSEDSNPCTGIMSDLRHRVTAAWGGEDWLCEILHRVGFVEEKKILTRNGLFWARCRHASRERKITSKEARAS